MWNAPHPIPIINLSLDLIGPYLSQNMYSMMDYSNAGTIKKILSYFVPIALCMIAECSHNLVNFLTSWI